MVYVRKPKAAMGTIKVFQPQVQPVALDPALQKKQQVAHTMRRFTARPASEQKQLARPTLTALRLYGEEYARVEGARPALQAQVRQQAAALPPTAVRDALGRQLAQQAPLPLIAAPKSQADWVTVMRQQAAQAESRLLGQKEVAQYTALQRQVTERLLQGFRQDRQEPAARYAEYAEHLVGLQRHASSGRVAGAFLTLMPQGERPALQRAIDETLQREAQQQAQDDAALSLHSLQRQLAELDQQATQPVYDRIKARRGAGNPLPEAVRRHLEHGLNHDLGAVRIHDDAEADHLSKSVNALAFTTGTDIYFQSGKFNPNSQSGLELLAHEVTHTVQQSRGQVGKGLDPDAGLENEARDMGRKLASISPRSLIAPVPHVGGPYARGVYNQRDSLARVQAGAAQTALLSPLRSLQRQSDQTIQRSFVGDKLSELAGQIAGYKPLTMALGYDPLAGKAIQADPNALLDALGNFVPGPFKDMLKVVREQKLVDKAWTWFKAELGKLQLGKVITDIKDALSGLPNIGKAKAILETAANKVRTLVTGSARKLAEIAVTAISAGLGPVGKQIMASLSQAGDVITQVLKNPAQFAKNLMNAMKQGFTGFVDRSGKWIQQGLGDFLTGSANIQLPKNLNVEGVLMTALSLMDLTYAALRGRLVKELGAGSEKKIAFLEQAGGALGQLKGGVGKAPEMKAVASQMGGEVLGGIKTEVTETLVKKGIAKVALMFNPAGAAIGAIMTAWSTIQTVIDKGKQIMSVIMNALSSIKEIAAGNVAGAATFIENTVGKALPVVFSFAANFLGIGNIGTRIKNLVKGMRQKLGIDKFIDGIVARLKKLVGAGKQVAGQAVNAAKGFIKGIFGKKTFTGGKQKHSVWVDIQPNDTKLMIASTPREAREQLGFFVREAHEKFKQDNQKEKIPEFNKVIQPHLKYAVSQINTEMKTLQTAVTTLPQDERKAKMEMGVRASNITDRVSRLAANLLDEIQKHGGGIGTSRTKMNLVTLTFNKVAKSGRKYDQKELALQLSEQENALRRMTVAEWLRRYPYYPGADKATRSSVQTADKKARDDYRVQEGGLMQDNLRNRLTKQYLAEGLSLDDAEDKAEIEAKKHMEQFMPTQAALHMPDKIAGGDYLLDIKGLGDKDVNSFIGTQWNSDGKINSIQSECIRLNTALHKTTYINVKLNLR